MREFLEESLRQKVSIQEKEDIYHKLPLVYHSRYNIYVVKTNGVFWAAIHPKNEIGIVMLRKDRITVEKVIGLNCAIFLDKASFYIKEKLLEEKIPFVIEGKQIFLPFIGYLLCSENNRKIAPVQLISFLTQKLLLEAIYGRWNNVKVSDAAKILGVSKMSISRSFDELEYLNINVLSMKGKSRVINSPENNKLFWEQYRNLLRTPVIRKYIFDKDVKLDKKAGISALCEYSLLSDNVYPTYAVTKKEIKGSGIQGMKQTDSLGEIGSIVLELGYFIDIDGKKAQDPLSIALSITQDELEDERIALSINEMLEECVWSRG